MSFRVLSTHPFHVATVLPVLGALGIGAAASAQCHTIDFEDLPHDTVVTDQYPGVTFSVHPGSCGGGEPLPRIAEIGSGAASGTKALRVPFGCPDFGPDTLVMTFDEAQRYVTFTVGGSVPGPFEAYAYSSASGIGIVLDSALLDAGTSPRSIVRLGDPEGSAVIRSVVVLSSFSDQEIIDDLSFGADPTPPIAEIENVSFRACACPFVSVQGIACDPDGHYASDRLEYRRADAGPMEPWTLHDQAIDEVCTTGTLYTFFPDMLPGGVYYLRLTVENECGLTASDTATIFIDETDPIVDVQRPAADDTVVCGSYDVVGRIWDHCGPTWVVTATPTAGGPPVLLETDFLDRCGVLATWDTTTVAEGEWKISVQATDECGNTTEVVRSVIVDRVACAMPDLDGDGEVGFGDLLILLTAWGPLAP